MNDDVSPEKRVPPPEDEQEKLGKRLRDAREYLNLSQETVADCLSIPRAAVSSIETGKRKVSSLELKQFASLYRRPVTYFLGEDASQGEQVEDETVRALFRTARALSDEDRRQVLSFAQFLRHAGRAPSIASESGDSTER